MNKPDRDLMLKETDKKEIRKSLIQAKATVQYFEQRHVNYTENNGYLWNVNEYLNKALKELKKCKTYGRGVSNSEVETDKTTQPLDVRTSCQ